MLLDDRLATVLRNAAQSDAATHTQYRQLLDLLGSIPEHEAGALVEAAYDRLDELGRDLPATVQSAILRAPGLRLRNRTLVARLAEGEPQVAAAAMATARLSEGDWLHLIPRLPLTARGFLRHRRDLPFSARQVLERLGVRDLVLPEPAADSLSDFVPDPPAAVDRAAPVRPDADFGIGALVKRIEAFQRARREAATAPRLPLDDVRPVGPNLARRAFDFSTDADDVVDWADPAMAPLVFGAGLGPSRPGSVAALDDAGARAFERRLPLRGAGVDLAGPPEIAGQWRIDAAPAFEPESGRFTGYNGRMRRPALQRASATPGASEAGDRMRQLLHELRTPVNAIQGFAELIQQQLFGPAPHEYRALAAAVAVDAARLLAGFEEVDRLARLEAGAMTLDEGECDLRDVIGRLLRRLEGVLRPRSARIDLTVASGADFAIGFDDGEAMRLIWRLLATLAGMLAPGEAIGLRLAGAGMHVTVEADLPAALAGENDLFAANAPAQPRAVSAGMFGNGFTLRLARAEAAAAGGRLEHGEDTLRLVLPALTGRRADHTVERRGERGPPTA